MSDPNPSPLERSHNQFRFQVLLRARTTSAITTILPRAITRTITRTGIPKTVLLTIDVDPVSLA